MHLFTPTLVSRAGCIPRHGLPETHNELDHSLVEDFYIAVLQDLLYNFVTVFQETVVEFASYARKDRLTLLC